MMQLAMSLGLTKVALLLSIIANLVIIIIILVIVITIIITIILVIVIVIIILIIVIMIINSQWSSWSRRCSRSAEGEDLSFPTSLSQGKEKLEA